MSTDMSQTNAFTQGPLVPTLLKTALPIVLVMSTNGLLTVADAMFLGHFVGPEALSAVTLMFPAYMLLIAAATLISGGMSSVLARALGGEQIRLAQGVFVGAHGLSLLAGATALLLFTMIGYPLILKAAEGSEPIARMAHIYLAITIWTSPLLFVLSVQSDALRCEGYVIQMAGVSLFVSLSNIAFNFLLVAILDFGVAGTACGTAMAQVLAFVFVIGFRMRTNSILKPQVLRSHSLTAHWVSILKLGAPQSLNFAGIALGSAATFASLQHFGSAGYEATVAAFGLMTRIMTFVFLPLLGLTQALQAMIGNNYGAGKWQRSDNTLRLGLVIAFFYCLSAQVLLTLFARQIGFLFVEDARIVGELDRIMPINIAMMLVTGPFFVIATYFQALGDAGRAAVISLIKPYFFFLPLLFVLPQYFGEIGIWLAGPAAECLLLLLTVAVLWSTARTNSTRWGLFVASAAK
ncbi:MATE family efflux transporter [uncultured Roseibium sp.]|uniref:MATE family efflux transporter n=1 Tax=uncultured Roseibium sp. TaxID=1936171 RepID=UPI00260AE08F|nr:MATE family efflux transporter [uncultured Roseibium sp.]